MLEGKIVARVTIALYLFISTLLFPVGATASDGQGTQAPNSIQRKRPVTVPDCIEMTRFADPFYAVGAASTGLVAHFSPDGDQFIVVLKKGNLRDDTNEYSLLRWETASLFTAPRSQTLLTFASSSNREALKQVTWIDNERILFLGEHPGETQQLYSFDLRTNQTTKFTSYAASLVSYARSRNGERIVFAAEQANSSSLSEESRRKGIRVDAQSLSDLLAGRVNPSGQHVNHDLFLLEKRTGKSVPIRVGWRFMHTSSPDELAISPDGRYLIVITEAPSIPNNWEEYQDGFLNIAVRRKRQPPFTGVLRYTLIDLDSGACEPLLDAPIGSGGSEVGWAPDSRSVVLAGAWLPLNVPDSDEQNVRRTNAFVVEIKIPSREIVKITRDDLRFFTWDPKTSILTFEQGRVNSITGTGTRSKVYYRKNENRWERIYQSERLETVNQPNITLDEDMNSPPRILAVDPRTLKSSVLMNLNPQFEQLSFGKVEEISWKAIDGHQVIGGLYFPPDYVAGKRYPLVIQTHGFNSKRFWMDGPYTSAAFAAQPLANKGFLVLQAEERFDGLSTPKEVLTEAASIEGAVDYLDQRALIDRSKVGLIGFSRTGLFVKYLLSHSKYAFAAASVTDGTEADYFPYLAFANSLPQISSEMETLNAASPFGQGLSSWFERSPGFNLDKVQTPFLAQALGPTSLLLGWEWFVGLSRLGKPVDMIYLPDAVHLIVKPLERMASLDTNVDWFCFWLKNEEDLQTTKAKQYARWRKLRMLRGSVTQHD